MHLCKNNMFKEYLYFKIIYYNSITASGVKKLVESITCLKTQQKEEY